MKKTYEYRAYPTTKQRKIFTVWLALLRSVYNQLAKRLIRNVDRKYARVVVPKVGDLKIRYHRPLPDGKIKTLTISKKASGWYATIVVEVPAPVEVSVNITLGVDVGLNSFVKVRRL